MTLLCDNFGHICLFSLVPLLCIDWPAMVEAGRWWLWQEVMAASGLCPGWLFWEGSRFVLLRKCIWRFAVAVCVGPGDLMVRRHVRLWTTESDSFLWSSRRHRRRLHVSRHSRPASEPRRHHACHADSCQWQRWHEPSWSRCVDSRRYCSARMTQLTPTHHTLATPFCQCRAAC